MDKPVNRDEKSLRKLACRHVDSHLLDTGRESTSETLPPFPTKRISPRAWDSVSADVDRGTSYRVHSDLRVFAKVSKIRFIRGRGGAISPEDEPSKHGKSHLSARRRRCPRAPWLEDARDCLLVAVGGGERVGDARMPPGRVSTCGWH